MKLNTFSKFTLLYSGPNHYLNAAALRKLHLFLTTLKLRLFNDHHSLCGSIFAFIERFSIQIGFDSNSRNFNSLRIQLDSRFD